jgi:ABC-2 type transport system permease protein
VGVSVWLVALFYVTLPIAHPLLIIVFALLGGGLLGALGIIAGIWAEKFDQMAAFQNFIIMPLTFLSGVFYSIHSLPSFWQKVSHLNPFFYMIDGFRYGFFGTGDIDPAVSLTVVSVSFLLLSAITLQLLKSGYKLRG